MAASAAKADDGVEISTPCAIVAADPVTSLPDLVARAALALANAGTAAEVLEARDMASVAYNVAKKAARLAAAKGAHDELIAAAHRVQGDALKIESQAKYRLADEYDAAQERGEVAKLGDNLPNVPQQNSKPIAADLGLSRKNIHEARIIRDAEKEEPGVVANVVDQALANGEEPTKAAVNKAAREAAKRPRRPRGYRNVVEETRRERDLRMLVGVWGAACAEAQADFRAMIEEGVQIYTPSISEATAGSEDK